MSSSCTQWLRMAGLSVPFAPPEAVDNRRASARRRQRQRMRPPGTGACLQAYPPGATAGQPGNVAGVGHVSGWLRPPGMQDPDAFSPGRGGKPAGKRSPITDFLQLFEQAQPDALAHVLSVGPVQPVAPADSPDQRRYRSTSASHACRSPSLARVTSSTTTWASDRGLSSLARPELAGIAISLPCLTGFCGTCRHASPPGPARAGDAPPFCPARLARMNRPQSGKLGGRRAVLAGSGPC